AKAGYIRLRVRHDGKRARVAWTVAQAGSEVRRRQSCNYRKERGFQSRKLIVSDSHERCKKRIQKRCSSTAEYQCTVHAKQNVFEKLTKKDFQEAKEFIKAIYEAPTLTMSRELKEKFVADYSNNQKYKKVIKILEDGYDDTVQFYSEPRETHTHIKTTNVLERLNAEVKRRT